MAGKRKWYRYTDESGRRWRLKAADVLAEIGGLVSIDESDYPLLPKSVEPRYMWIKETERPTDRLPLRHKIILERGRFKEIVSSRPVPSWSISGTVFGYLSYYGETMYAE